jgi:hypothetical protein
MRKREESKRARSTDRSGGTEIARRQTKERKSSHTENAPEE